MKWNRSSFEESLKNNCKPHTSNVVIDLIKFAETSTGIPSWGRGEGYGTMTYKCDSDDYGIIPLFLLTTNGQIKFQLNYLRNKVKKKEVIRDYQLKLESNFMLDFDEEFYPSDVFHDISELFVMKADVDKFMSTIVGITDRLYQ
ncbi:MAG: hypothetical protein H8E60_10810 [Candidatus Marinimicrobia bacterium]|nr:hypothetical protein [Candidatus Neomarinimicrobiota bacterium]